VGEANRHRKKKGPTFAPWGVGTREVAKATNTKQKNTDPEKQKGNKKRSEEIRAGTKNL